MILTVKQRVKVDQACYDNPLYLAWLNELAGWSYWLFQKNQLNTYQTGSEKLYAVDFEDLENSESQEEVLTLESVRKITMGADGLTLNDVKLIGTMLDSVKVQMLTNPTTWQADGPDWLTVFVERGSFMVYETEPSKHRIEFTIRLQPRIKQAQ